MAPAVSCGNLLVDAVRLSYIEKDPGSSRFG